MEKIQSWYYGIQKKNKFRTTSRRREKGRVVEILELGKSQDVMEGSGSGLCLAAYDSNSISRSTSKKHNQDKRDARQCNATKL
jgi:hypothetical protein